MEVNVCQTGFLSKQSTVHWNKTTAVISLRHSKRLEVKVGMHQGSVLSPLLFVIVMEAITREFRVALSWNLL